MMQTARGLLVLTFGLVILAGCGGTDPTSTPVAGNPPTVAATPAAGGADTTPAAAATTAPAPPAGPTSAVPVPAGWQDVAPANSGFHASLPAAPTAGQLTLTTLQGQVDLQTFYVVRSSMTYTVGFGDYPADAVQKTEAVRILDAARDALLTSASGTMVKEDGLMLPGAKRDDGRAVNLTAPGGIAYNARLYLLGRRLYLLQVAGPDQAQATAESAKLFATFRATLP